jgi:hypothetical protein
MVVISRIRGDVDVRYVRCVSELKEVETMLYPMLKILKKSQ